MYRLGRVVIKEEFVVLCGGYRQAALIDWLLSAHAASVSTGHGGWVYESSGDMAAALMMDVDERTIRRYVAAMIDLGIVDREQTGSGNLTRYMHRPNLRAIRDKLNRLGYPLDGYGWNDEEGDFSLPKEGGDGGRTPVGQNVQPIIKDKTKDQKIKDNSNRARAYDGRDAINAPDSIPTAPKPEPALAITPEPEQSRLDPIAVMFRLFQEGFKVAPRRVGALSTRYEGSDDEWADEFRWLLELVAGDVDRAMRVYGYASGILTEAGRTSGKSYIIAGPKSLRTTIANMDLNEKTTQPTYRILDDGFSQILTGYETKLRYP